MNQKSGATAGADTIQFQEVVQIVRRNLIPSVVIIIVVAVLITALAYILPKRYISKAVLNIQAAYFQVPLVGDLVSNSNDPSENKAQRESIMRLALSNDFLDELGNKYRMFRYPPTERLHSVERDILLSMIEYIGIGSNSYQISVRAGYPELAYEMTQAVLDQMIATLVSQRMDKLTRTRTAIETNLNSLKQDIAESGGPSSRLTHDTESLEEAEAKLASLQQRFTSSHPEVILQQEKVERLRSIQRRTKEIGGADAKASGGLSGSRRALEDLYDDLLRKFNYLNIVIDMEKGSTVYPYLSVLDRPSIPTTPLFPKKMAFGLGGIVLGIVIAMLRIVFMEMRRGTFANPVNATQILDAPFLGTLPPLRAIEYKTKALPPPPPDPRTE